MALIPPFFLDTVVAIGFVGEYGNLEYSATGFLYGKHVHGEGDEGKYVVFLITNEHALNEESVACIRMNPEGSEPAREFNVRLLDAEQNPLSFVHPDADIDLAAIPINIDALKAEKIRHRFFNSTKHVANRAKCLEMGISEGDGVFVLGFPLGLVGEERNYVIVRQGAIAQIQHCLVGDGKEILIDATILPGSSGSPVIIKPDAASISGTKSISQSILIGVVSHWIPYREVAVSIQTKQPRVTFEENSGLAKIIPMDYVEEVTDLAISELRAKGQLPSVKVDEAKLIPD